MSAVLKAENISKLYRLGTVNSGTLKDDLARYWARITRQEDPFAKVGETNDRTIKGASEYVWALKDTSFEVQQGDVLGIIGKNGAGKSTLLKILSRVTSPTTGKITMKGRAASLLEVGTGFHPELTGRENIYLNGAILGMRKSEIKRKFDEIVDFSGVERYVDTPVKRYSSGMYVRLAFAVAAHLEPEILILDEVLAVGDAEFQKKCLGKMKDVSEKEGRTVLFVSHNMAAVSSLCNKAIFLMNGTLHSSGPTEQIVNEYLRINLASQLYREMQYEDGFAGIARLTKAWVSNPSDTSSIFTVHSEVYVHFQAKCQTTGDSLNFSMTVNSAMGQSVFNSLSPSLVSSGGIITGVCKIPANLLNNGVFNITVVLAKDRSTPVQVVHDILTFEVADKRENENWYGDISHHLIRPQLEWNMQEDPDL